MWKICIVAFLPGREVRWGLKGFNREEPYNRFAIGKTYARVPNFAHSEMSQTRPM